MCTYNCKNVKTSLGEITSLCEKSDILMLQETWLSNQELGMLGMLHPDFYAKGVAQMDDADGIRIGRPHGGLAVLWRKTIGCTITVEDMGDSRLQLVRIVTALNTIALLNIYFPFYNGNNSDEYAFYLGKVGSVLNSFTYAAAIGDFNANVSSQHHKFGNELKTFCKDENCILTDVVHCPSDSFTFISEAHSTVAWLDHMVSTIPLHLFVKKVSIDNSLITSDHFPLSIQLECEVNTSEYIDEGNTKSRDNRQRQPIWSKLSDSRRKEYSEHTETFLSDVQIDHSLVLCYDPCCNDDGHKAAIETMYNQITDAILNAQERLVQGMTEDMHGYVQIPEWKDVCSDQYQLARDAFRVWVAYGKPRTGSRFQEMKTAKAKFKLLLRECKTASDRRESDRLAEKLLRKDQRQFWKEINKICKGQDANAQPESVGGMSGKEQICEMWKEHFSELLNPIQHMDATSQYTNIGRDCEFSRFKHAEVGHAVSKLKCGKAAGNDGLSAESIRYAGVKINILLSLLFNAIVCHGYIPLKLMDTLIVPIIKDKKGDITSKNNYRPIALTTIVSKLLETILIHRYRDLLTTTDNQFGFKEKVSTDLCVFTFKQIVEYYRTRSSPVYVCFLDASKAFDRVNHSVLFNKLRMRGLPDIVIRVLSVWYKCQQFYVKWGHVTSDHFNVTSGVRQGGILSPALFNVYVDGLSEKLCSMPVGCYINDVCYNHLIYADDTVLLAPSPSALQSLISACVEFAKKNYLVFNSGKTKCMTIKPDTLHNLYVPRFYIECDSPIKIVKEEVYLGCILNEKLTDDNHIVKETRNNYIRGNMLIRKFRQCSIDVKIKLYKTYCSNVYCCPVWCDYKRRIIQKLHVSWNKILKVIMNVPYDHSASMLFLVCGLNNFYITRRKLVFNFRKRVRESKNVLVNNFSKNTVGNVMFKHWRDILGQ